MLNNLLALLKGSIAHLFGDLYLLGIDIVQVDGGVLLLPFDIGIEIKKGLIRRETSVNLHEFLPTPIGQTPHTKHPGDPLQHFLPALVHRLRHLVDHYLHFPHPLDHSVPHLHRIRHISVIQVLINFKDALQLLNAFASPQLQSRFVVLVNLLQMLGGLLTATRPVPLKFMTHRKPSLLLRRTQKLRHRIPILLEHLLSEQRVAALPSLCVRGIRLDPIPLPFSIPAILHPFALVPYAPRAILALVATVALRAESRIRHVVAIVAIRCIKHFLAIARR